MSRRVVAPARSPAAELEQLGLQCQQLRLTRVAQTLPGTNTHVAHSQAAYFGEVDRPFRAKVISRFGPS